MHHKRTLRAEVMILYHRIFTLSILFTNKALLFKQNAVSCYMPSPVFTNKAVVCISACRLIFYAAARFGFYS
jgi:hypothetical protein